MLRFFLACSMFLLAACKPDVDIKLSTKNIVEVAETNEGQLVPFSANIGNKYTKVDDKKKAEVEAIAAVIKKYFDDVEVDISYGAKGFQIEVEGELQLAVNSENITNPWFFAVSKPADGQYILKLQQTRSWNAFANELQKISFTAKPDNFLPVNLKIKNKGGTILVGGAILNGKHLSGFEKIDLDGSRINLNYDGDHWDNAPASFLFISPK